MNQDKLYAIDLFSGCGGLTAGLKKAGIEVRAAVELDAIAMKSYKKNHSEVYAFEKDICDVDGEDLLQKARISATDLFLLVACPPCQGFSSIRKDGENDSRNNLVFEYIRLIKKIKPPFILMENVAGMSRGKGKETFRKAYEAFEKDYKCVYDILNAADFGVPQTRKRLVVHGIRKDIYEKYKDSGIEISLPKETHIDPKKKCVYDHLTPWKTASVILGLPKIDAGESYQGEIYNHVCNNMSQRNVERIQYIRAHGGSRTCLPETLALQCHKKDTGHTDVYGIMDMNKPAPTITGGCMHYSKGRYGHPVQDRALSAREAARLQSFDDDYVFYGTNAQIAQQIGNAVPVDLAKASGKYFVSLFEIIDHQRQSNLQMTL